MRILSAIISLLLSRRPTPTTTTSSKHTHLQQRHSLGAGTHLRTTTHTRFQSSVYSVAAMLNLQSCFIAALAASAPAFARLQRLNVRQTATAPFVVEPLPDGKLDLTAKYSLRPATDLPNRTGQLNANQTHIPRKSSSYS